MIVCVLHYILTNLDLTILAARSTQREVKNGCVLVFHTHYAHSLYYSCHGTYSEDFAGSIVQSAVLLYVLYTRK